MDTIYSTWMCQGAHSCPLPRHAISRQDYTTVGRYNLQAPRLGVLNSTKSYWANGVRRFLIRLILKINWALVVEIRRLQRPIF